MSEVIYKWSIQPWKSLPTTKQFGFVVAIVLVAVLGTVMLRNAVLAVFVAALFASFLSEFWCPTLYTMTHEVAQSRRFVSTNEIELKSVKRVLVSGRQVKLSPLEKESRLDSFRGITLVTTDEVHDPMLVWLRGHLGEDVEFVGYGTN